MGIGCNEARAPASAPKPTAEELADFRPENAGAGTPEAQARHWVQLLENGNGSLDGYFRQRRELVRLGSAAVPALCDAIARGAEAEPNLVDNCCDILAEIKDPFAVPYLIDLLDHPTSQITVKAVEALERIHDSRAIAPLVKHALATPEPNRAPFLRALGSFQDEVSARLICGEIADDRSLETRILAIQLLGGMGSTACVSALDGLLSDSNGQIRLEAAGSLLRLGRADSALSALRETLKSGVPEMRARAVTLFAQSGSPSVIPILTDLLATGDSLRVVVVAALGQFGDRARAPLQSVADDKDPAVSQVARLALVKSGDVGMRSRLVQELSDGSPDVRQRAVEILKQARATEAVDPMIRWARTTKDPVERRALVRALVTIGDSRALPFLVELLLSRTTESESLTEWQQAVANLGELALPALEKEYDSRLHDTAQDQRLRIIRTLGLIARDDSLAVLERLFMSESNPALRMALRTTARSLRRCL
ncbi:MAG: HEAT repeat domain-containing protein [Planctomycetes bacterium]|nr:HEAT repeat domain-containing protein [Planctomycetota bacterium]MBI3844658.1 HEAT repeat domain-containing protein [Planctomycetota bacterium]